MLRSGNRPLKRPFGRNWRDLKKSQRVKNHRNRCDLQKSQRVEQPTNATSKQKPMRLAKTTACKAETDATFKKITAGWAETDPTWKKLQRVEQKQWHSQCFPTRGRGKRGGQDPQKVTGFGHFVPENDNFFLDFTQSWSERYFTGGGVGCNCPQAPKLRQWADSTSFILWMWEGLPFVG